MRDRAFTERLQQIKAKYGYAHQETIQSAVPQAHTHRNNTPAAHRIQSPSIYNYPQSSKLYEQNTVPKTQYMAAMTQRSRQPLKEEVRNTYTYEKAFKIPMSRELDERYSPIKQLGANKTVLMSPRNSISPQHGVSASNFKKPVSNISPIKRQYPYQAKHYQAPKKIANNENLNQPKQREYSKTIQKNSHQQNIYHKLKSHDNPNPSQFPEDKVDPTRNPLEQCHYNIDTIDKMQDRIALALKKYQKL